MVAPARDPVDVYLSRLTGFNRRSEHTVAQYRSVCRRFLERCDGPSPDADDIYAFVGSRDAQATKAWTFAIVRGLFEANDWRWPLPPTAYPRIEEQVQVQAPPASIGELVAKAPTLEPDQAFYLALATIYGFRRIELGSVTAASFESRGRRLRVKTVKGGTERLHRVPDEIRPFLAHPPDKSRMASAMSARFSELCEGCSIPLSHGAGWHSIRRSLISHLALSAPHLAVVRFMGWKSGGGPKIFYTYARPPEEDVDRVIFEHHPFLSMWGKLG